ncbi:uncharacterized protein LOC143917775 [Arctopsyche grandis]|uniref:uncharacterized protein LOC143917775 n=1 Tax=Arctopsyche grandis TaxID=121162 RepID=UPI00406D6ABC
MSAVSGTASVIRLPPCRLCLRRRPLTTDVSRGRLRSLLHTLFSIWVKSDDRSKFVCMECLKKVMTFYEFYKKVQKAQKRLLNADLTDISSDEMESCDFIQDTANKLKSYEIPICKIEECNDCENFNTIKKEPMDFYAVDIKRNAGFPTDSISPKEECMSSEDGDDISDSEKCDSLNEDGGNHNSESFIANTSKHKKNTKLKTNTNCNPININEENKLEDDSHDIDHSFPSEIYRNGKLLLKGPTLENAMNKFYNLDCNMCKDKVQFTNLNGLFKHYESVHETKGYVMCCNSKLYYRRAICVHMARHLQPSAFECPICEKSMSRPNTVKLHMQTHLPESEKPHKCDQCDKRFRRIVGLNNHKLSHLPANERDTYDCKICEKTFTLHTSFVGHLATVHGNVKYLCAECGRSFQTKTNLSMHMLTHDPTEKHKATCSKCGLVFKNKPSLKQHMKRHADLLQCTLCEFSTPLQQKLKVHMIVKHSDSKPYSCVVCDKRFKFKQGLNTHMAQHTGERKYTCPFCPKTFVSSGNYYTHRKRMHSEEINQTKKIRLRDITDQ